MISPLLFGVLAIVDFVLIVYSFYDSQNRVYGNIISSLLAVILSFLLAQMIISGGVVTVEKFISSTTENGSTVYQYQDMAIQTIDSSVGYLFMLIGVIMLIVLLFFIMHELSDRKDERASYED